jgi:5-methyltetrahydrofolate--homocysteine methyltransferase
MEETIRQIRKVKPDAKIMVGGAVLDADSASGIGADYYGRDAKEAVGIAQEYFRN